MGEWREILTFPWSECQALSSDHHPPLQTFSPLHLQRSLPNATLSQPLPQARVSDVRYAIPINCKVRTPKRMHVYFVKLHSSLCSSFRAEIDAYMSAYTSDVFRNNRTREEKETPRKLCQQNKAQGKSCQKAAHTAWLTTDRWEAQSTSTKDGDKLIKKIAI